VLVSPLVLTAWIAFGASLAKPPCEAKVDDGYRACANQEVLRYLESLTEKDVGAVTPGVPISKGFTPLQGMKFLGRVTGLGRGRHVYVFEERRRRKAYAWLDERALPLTLPRCPDAVSPESAYALTGDVYTWKALQTGHGIVEVMCVSPDWKYGQRVN
jgi:hypothetical protein